MNNKLNVSKEKRLVLKESWELYLDDLFGGYYNQPSKTCEEVATQVLAFPEKFKMDVANGDVSRFRVERDCDGMQCVYFDVYRQETDKEFNTRLEKEARQKERSKLAREKKKQSELKAKEQTEAAERAEFERLKKKFGSY